MPLRLPASGYQSDLRGALVPVVSRNHASPMIPRSRRLLRTSTVMKGQPITALL